jgi:hypothetical protein
MRPITELPSKLTAYAGKPSPPYRKLWEMVVQGAIPAERHNGRWHFAEANVPAIATVIGLTRGEEAPKKRARAA